jgi:hypothetical protein
MPPLSLLCYDFIGSLFPTERKSLEERRRKPEIVAKITLSDDEDENDDEDDKMNGNQRTQRLKAIENEEKFAQDDFDNQKKAEMEIEEKLKKLMMEEIDNFEI